MKNERVLIVQPHSDDALFSCAHLFLTPEEWGVKDVEVLTVENDPLRAKEDKKLYDFIGIKCHHIDTGEWTDKSYYTYFHEYKEIEDEAVSKTLKSIYGEKQLEKIRWGVETALRKYIEGGWEIYSPWGVGHPFHHFIHLTLQVITGYKNIYYYRDFPHSYKRRSQPQIARQAVEFELVRKVPVEGFHEVKWKLAEKFYRSQSGLLFFEHGYIEKRLPEEIYTDGLPF